MPIKAERRDVVVLFTKIRSITRLSDYMDPDLVVQLVGEHLNRAESIIETHGGVVHSYMADMIVAVWGTETGHSDGVFGAVGAALAMREDLSKMNEKRLANGHPAIRIGMSVTTGQIVIGEAQIAGNADIIAVGSPFSNAMRLEAKTLEQGCDLLVEKAAAEHVTKEFIFLESDVSEYPAMLVRGFYDESGKEYIVETPYSSQGLTSTGIQRQEQHAPQEPVREVPAEEIEAREKTPPFGTDAASEEFFVDPDLLNQPAQAGEWFLRMNGEVLGPFSKEEIISGLGSMEIAPDTMACPDLNEGAWTQVSMWPEFAEYCQSAA